MSRPPASRALCRTACTRSSWRTPPASRATNTVSRAERREVGSRGAQGDLSMSRDSIRLAFFGGVYNNWRALDSAAAHVRRAGGDGLYALGDFGGFGPHPDRVFPILLDAGALPIQGNYEESLSTGAT